MKRFNSFKTLAFIPVLLLGLTAPAIQAETAGSTRYVTDSIDIPLRSGGSHKHRIKRMLPSGTAVKLLEVDKSGWAKIEYKNTTGWMPSSVLEGQPIARERLAQQIQKTTALEGKYNSLQKELTTLKARHDETNSELETTKQEKYELTQELDHLKAVSGNAMALDKQNQEMKSRLSRLEDENAIMREQIEQSEEAIKRQWFLTGGGVLLLGLLLGRFFRLPQKRKKWGEF